MSEPTTATAAEAEAPAEATPAEQPAEGHSDAVVEAAEGEAPAADGDGAGQEDAVHVQEPALEETAGTGPARAGAPLDIVLDSMVPISVSLGETALPIRQLLQTGPGSVVVLDRQVGGVLDVFIEGRRFATGRLIVVGERLGIRIEEILPPPPKD